MEVDDILKTILQVIKKRRQDLGYSQQEMADLLGLKQGSYSHLENGTTEVTLKRLLEIGEILNIQFLEMNNLSSTDEKQVQNPFSLQLMQMMEQLSVLLKKNIKKLDQQEPDN